RGVRSGSDARLVRRFPRAGAIIPRLVERLHLEAELAGEHRPQLLAQVLELIEEPVGLLEELLARVALDPRDRVVDAALEPAQPRLDPGDRVQVLVAERPDCLTQLVGRS